MRVYITGSASQEDLNVVCDSIKDMGHEPRTPFDVIDESRSDDENLVVRLQEILACNAVVTTSPAQGPWGEGADRELKVARAANMTVIPYATLTPETLSRIDR